MTATSLPTRRSLLGITEALSTPSRFRGLVILNAGLLWFILLSGALVRLTKSGLGCPDWPLCDGGVVPQADYHQVIEYTNRLASAGIIVATIVTWFTARRVRTTRRAVTGLALAAMLMSIGQIPLGGVTVLSGLHPMMVGSHFVLSIAALTAGVLLVVVTLDDQRGVTRAWDARRGPFALIAGLSLCAVIITGVLVTAAGPHSGDDDVLKRFGNLETAAWVHVRAVGLLVVLMLVLALWLWREGTTDPWAGRLAMVFLPLLAIQIGIGEFQYRHALPWEVIAVHVAVAGLVWMTGVATAWSIARPGRPGRRAA